MITQRRLQHLLALVEHAHFGRAAQALNISQPALTKSIQALEAELGATLLDRKRGAIALTVFGELVLQRGRSLLSAEADLRREVALLAGHEIGSLKVAISPYPSVVSGYPAIKRLLAQHPKVNVMAHVASWREVVRQVTARDVDLGIAELSQTLGNEQLITELIGQHRGHFFCRPEHPILRRGPVSMNQLVEFPWLSTRLPLRVASHLPRSIGAAGTIEPLTGDFVPAIELDMLMQIGDFLEHSDALALASLTIMERALLAGDVTVVPTPDLNIHSNYGFIHLNNRSLTPVALAFMQEVRTEEAEKVKREAILASTYAAFDP
jgi:DNA-binding transcriptional LysR family regulator